MSQDTTHKAASIFTQELFSWRPSLESADSELLTELPTLVARSRDLVRNNGVAAGAIQTLVDNVVGTGLRLSALPNYRALGKDKTWADEWSRQVEALWRSWAESTDCDAAQSLTFAGLTTQVFRSSLVNGEALTLPLWLPHRDHGVHTHFATTLQLVDTDRLANPPHKNDNKHLRGGIEINRYGAPKAYWLSKTHPSDPVSGLSIKPSQWQRIPRYTNFGRLRVIHVHDRERTGQHRGKPLLTAVMPLFKMLDNYEHSELQAAVMNAMIAAFVETPLDGESVSELFGGSSEDYMAARNGWRTTLKGGAVIPIFPGDKVSPFTPSRPNAAYPSFVDNVLRHIGTGLNLPTELLRKDFSQTNYSSARAALMEAWRFFLGRRQWLATYWAKPVYELWLEEAINKNMIEVPNFYQNKALWTRCKWIGPGRGWIDPVKEAQASQLRMAIGLSSLEDECAVQGLDWEEILEQRKREQDKLDELGLSINLETTKRYRTTSTSSITSNDDTSASTPDDDLPTS
jgi:lambda family phage portal protein